MNEFELILLPLVAGLLVLSTHVPLGREVLKRGIIFIDLAIAQIAALGLLAADYFQISDSLWQTQLMAFLFAIAGASALQWGERYWREMQEAVIGIAFVLAATAGILAVAGNPHGGENLKDVLVGQILWVDWHAILYGLIPSSLILVVWYALPALRAKLFYVLLAFAVTVSVQLVGVYLVFATLILPAIVVRRLQGGWSMLVAYAVGIIAYLSGLVVSVLVDWPTGATIVWTLAIVSAMAVWLMKLVCSRLSD